MGEGRETFGEFVEVRGAFRIDLAPRALALVAVPRRVTGNEHAVALPRVKCAPLARLQQVELCPAVLRAVRDEGGGEPKATAARASDVEPRGGDVLALLEACLAVIVERCGEPAARFCDVTI